MLTVKKAKAQKTSKASLDTYYENIQLECSKYVKSEFVYKNHRRFTDRNGGDFAKIK